MYYFDLVIEVMNNNGYFQGIHALCKHSISDTHKFYIFFSLQMKCQILTCINSLKISYIPIIWLGTVWERFIFQKTKKK